MTIYLSDLLIATGGQLHGKPDHSVWEDFCHDSRLAQPGQIFVALRTPTGDGHDHIVHAVANGCTGVLCQHLVRDHPAVTTVLVPDTGDALHLWAAHILRKYEPLVIAITGSSGKTTAKELAADLLEYRFPGKVFRTRDSYNDRLGIPLSLGRMKPEHKVAVMELGTDAHGEIAQLADLVRPAIAAITVIQDAHIGTFGSVHAIAEEKTSIFHSLDKHGIAIVNADDQFQRPFMEGQKYKVLAHSVDLGTSVQLRSSDPGSDPTWQGLFLQFDRSLLSSLRHGLYQYRHLVQDKSPQTLSNGEQNQLSGPQSNGSETEFFTLKSKLLGIHQQIPIRTAISIALLLGVTVNDIIEGVKTFQSLPGRLQVLTGINGSLLLDDTYNASPSATRAALQVLASFPANRRIAILGEHSGLGPNDEAVLEKLGPEVSAAVHDLVVIGPQTQAIARGALMSGLTAESIFYTDTATATVELVRPMLSPGTVVLLKGSREARLERVALELLEDSSEASGLLVRQNPAWHGLRLRNSLRPTWVEIDTLALADNIRATQARLQPHTKIIAVLKADAYGHGAPTVARVAAQAGVDMLAVACQPEAQTLRKAGVTTPILVLGYTPPWQTRPAIELELQLTIYERNVAVALNQAAMDLGRHAQVHVKVDTGMGRLGLFPADVPGFLRFLKTLTHLDVVGLFSHMAIADEPDDPHTTDQLNRFSELLAQLDLLELRPPLVHVANTATLLTRPEAHYDAVRLGIGLYGLSPGPDIPLPPGYRPALTWKTTIAQVKTLSPGSPVGYGLTYRTQGMQTIAIIPVGYADGFRRAPNHWGYVLVRGKRAPLVGRVSMDQAAIDVSDIPGVRSGDEVVLIGRQGEEVITADDVAKRLGTINYEVISAILARVPRMPE